MTAPGTAARAGAIDGDSRKARNRQLVLFSAIAAALLVAFALWMGAGGGKAPAPGAHIDAELAGPGTAEDSWTRRSEGRLGLIETRLRDMETRARQLTAENERLRTELKDNDRNARDVIDKYKAALDETLVPAAQRGQAQGPAGTPAPEGDLFAPAGTPRQSAPGAANVPGGTPGARLIESFTLDGAVPESPGLLGDDPGALDAKPLSLWLPAGSHAEAVVLAGVDASAGISSQGDPRPVLLRLTGPAWTAAPGADGGTALSVDIAGCTVTGAAHGDLSSEKVYVRLRTMTCAAPASGAAVGPGSVVETEVAGFVAGSGKTGVRGPVVSREGALIEKAFLAGLVSGVGQGVSGAFQPQAVATGGAAAVANTGLGDIGRARPRRGCGERRAEGRRLHDPPRRTVPAGDSAPRRDPRHRGVPRRRAPRRRAPRIPPPDKERRHDPFHPKAFHPNGARATGCRGRCRGRGARRMLVDPCRRVLAVPARPGRVVHERRGRRSGGAGGRRRGNRPRLRRAALPGKGGTGARACARGGTDRTPLRRGMRTLHLAGAAVRDGNGRQR